MSWSTDLMKRYNQCSVVQIEQSARLNYGLPVQHQLGADEELLWHMRLQCQGFRRTAWELRLQEASITVSLWV